MTKSAFGNITGRIAINAMVGFFAMPVGRLFPGIEKIVFTLYFVVYATMMVVWTTLYVGIRYFTKI